MFVDHNWEMNSSESFERPTQDFRDNERKLGMPNVIFQLIITTTMSNFDVLQILIDEGSSLHQTIPRVGF